MKRVCFFVLVAGLAVSRTALAQTVEKEAPSWVSTAATGDDAALVEGWYRQGFIKSKKGAPEKTLKQRALNEIRYISNDEQRDQLQALKANDDVETFMKKFWTEIDPSDGTSENELQREYYERFAYVNENFNSFREGWKTDRGRVYILYGAPDEIQRHAWVDPNFLGNGASIKDAESWIYSTPTNTKQSPNVFEGFRRGRVKFVFADFDGIRDYRQIYSTEAGEIADPRVFVQY